MPAIIIPARLHSSRLPRKLLLAETGMELLWHTVQRTLESKLANIIIIATEDDEIERVIDAASSYPRCGPPYFNIENVVCVRTPPCDSGTERVAWVVENNKMFTDHFDYVVNFQGDEPELHGAYADFLIEELRSDNHVDVATLAAVGNVDDYTALSVVKVVTDHNDNAMYFSRSPIPYNAFGYETHPDTKCLIHFGMYAYGRAFLLAIPRMPETTLASEGLEQLQWLQSGFRIKVSRQTISSVGIDTREEYDQFVIRCKKQSGD